MLDFFWRGIFDEEVSFPHPYTDIILLKLSEFPGLRTYLHTRYLNAKH